MMNGLMKAIKIVTTFAIIYVTLGLLSQIHLITYHSVPKIEFLHNFYSILEKYKIGQIILTPSYFIASFISFFESSSFAITLGIILNYVAVWFIVMVLVMPLNTTKSRTSRDK